MTKFNQLAQAERMYIYDKNLLQRLVWNSDFPAGFCFIGKKNTSGMKSGLTSNTQNVASANSYLILQEK